MYGLCLILVHMGLDQYFDFSPWMVSGRVCYQGNKYVAGNDWDVEFLEQGEGGGLGLHSFNTIVMRILCCGGAESLCRLFCDNLNALSETEFC